MKMQSYIFYRVKYKINFHKRMNKIKLTCLCCAGWLLNKLFGVSIEVHLIEEVKDDWSKSQGRNTG